MMLDLNNKTTDSDVHSRQKRTLTDFTRSPFSRWTMPITYKFDGSHCEYFSESLLFVSLLNFITVHSLVNSAWPSVHGRRNEYQQKQAHHAKHQPYPWSHSIKLRSKETEICAALWHEDDFTPTFLLFILIFLSCSSVVFCIVFDRFLTILCSYVHCAVQLFIRWRRYVTRSVTGLTTRASASKKFLPTRKCLQITCLLPAHLAGIQFSCMFQQSQP